MEAGAGEARGEGGKAVMEGGVAGREESTIPGLSAALPRIRGLRWSGGWGSRVLGGNENNTTTSDSTTQLVCRRGVYSPHEFETESTSTREAMVMELVSRNN